MISLKIGNEERRNGSIEKRWIAQQLRKRNGQPVCVKMTIREGDVRVSFSSAACAGGGGGRAPNRKERKLLELWDQRGLNGTDIKPGMINSFLNQYDKYI